MEKYRPAKAGLMLLAGQSLALKLRLPVLHSAHLSESIYIHDNHHPYNSTATLSPTSDVCDSDVKTERSE